MVLAWTLVALMLPISAFAFARRPTGSRLPMQWGLRGQVNWSAPRVLAVLFAPALAAAVIALVLSFGDAGWIASIVAAVFLVAHAGHLYFALRSIERDRG